MKKKFILFTENVLETFAVIVLVFIFLTATIGKESEKISRLFLLGSEGIAIKTLIQLFSFAIVICLLKLFILTDMLFKNLKAAIRIVLFFVFTGIALAIFALAFEWTQNVPEYWLLVYGSYALSTVVSILITRMLNKKEDKKMNTALKARFFSCNNPQDNSAQNPYQAK